MSDLPLMPPDRRYRRSTFSSVYRVALSVLIVAGNSVFPVAAQSSSKSSAASKSTQSTRSAPSLLRRDSATGAAAAKPPLLKAIDPAQAKMDAMPKPQSAVPDANSGISGAPISGDRPRSNLPSAGPGGGNPQYSPYGAQPGYPVYGQPQGVRPGYPSQAPGYPPQQAGYPPQAQPGYPPQAQPGYPPQAPPGYPAQGSGYPMQAPPGYPSQSPPGYPVQAPPGYPSYPPSGSYGFPQQQPGFVNAPPPSYGQAGPINTPPGYPGGQQGGFPPPQQGRFPPTQQASYPQSPPGYPQMPPGGLQQPPPSSSNPTGRARFGGGIPQGARGGQPAPTGQPGFVTQPGTVPGGSPPGYPQIGGGGYPQQPTPGGYPQGGGGYPQTPPGYPQGGSPGGYPPTASTGGASGNFASTNFPSPNLIPDFNKPLPLDASNRGPAQGWTTNVPQQDPDEARVTRLEKVAFGSTYPEHEVVDRIDHLEREIFGEPSSGDIPTRIMRLEAKLGGRGAFNQGGSQPQYGSFNNGGSGGTGEAARELSLNSASSTEQDAESENEDPDGDTTSDGKPDQLASANANVSNKVSAVKIPFDKGAGDYINQVRRFNNNSVARWTHFPVKVRLPDDASPGWRKLMESGMEKWGRYLPMKVASASEAADVEVSFVNHLVPRALGVTRLTARGGHMKVYIFMLRPTYYQNSISEKTLAHAFTHELGHAIGVFGHSDKPGDTMFVFEVAKGKLTQEKLGSLSSRDVNTLKLIYDAEPLQPDFSLTAPLEWSCLHGAS